MKFSCPVCGGNLFHRRVNDGFTSHSITKQGKVKVLADKSSGYDEVMCGKNAAHDIPETLVEAVIDLIATIEEKYE